MSVRYLDDPGDPARLNKQGRPEPTRQPRRHNRLYCMIWPDHDLFKVGLSSGVNARDISAARSIAKYFAHRNIVPESYVEWRAELPMLEEAPWGDCQRLEMVFATAVKQRLKASAASAVGLEWLTCTDLDQIAWKEELTEAATAALRFSGLEPSVKWSEFIPRHGLAQLDAHRTMRNGRGLCAMKDCGAQLPPRPVTRGGFEYCSEAHAQRDSDARTALTTAT
jgi:hypothetical protein